MNMSRVVGLILGGGQGAGLYPLTLERSEPAVPIAGKYRLVDIPLSNCLHADINKIAILTQFNSVSLHRHIHRTYVRDFFSKGWFQILPAEQTRLRKEWYRGTADAVRQRLIEISDTGADYVLILAADQLYRMDFRHLLSFHQETGADITIAVHPVDETIVSHYGILRIDDHDEIIAFVEKPDSIESLTGFKSFRTLNKPYLASTGIYVFGIGALVDLLETEKGDDFGLHIIPNALSRYSVKAFHFEGFWEDIGSLWRYYKVNMKLASEDPPFDFYDPERPIYTRPRFLPGSTVDNSRLERVLLAEGCRIHGGAISDAVVGTRSIVGLNTIVRNSIIMGADYFETRKDLSENERMGIPAIGIGSGARIDGAIIDKNVRIGNNVSIQKKYDRQNTNQDNWLARDGLIIVPKNAIIPDNTQI